MAKKPGRKFEIELDWYYISKESVRKWLLIFLVAAGGVSALAYMIAHRGDETEQRARREISDAEDMISRCRLLPESGRPQEEIDAATAKVTEAKTALAAQKIGDAVNSAVAAQQIARKLLGQPLRGDANIVDVGGKVEVQRANRSTWENAKVGMKLFEGDFMKTGATGAAEVMASDGTLYRIKAETLFEVQKTSTIPGAPPGSETRRSGGKLIVGLIDTNTGEGTRSIVKTDAATADIASRSSVGIDVDTSKTTGVSTFRGSATLTTESGAQIVLGGGERAVASPRGGGVSGKVKIPETPHLLGPDNNAVFDIRKKEPVAIRWSAAKDAQRYRLQIARSRLFIPDSIVVDLPDRQRTEAVVSAVEEGSFFWRVSALGRGSLPSEWSDVRRFKVVSGNLSSINDTTPPDLVLERPKVISNYVLVSGKTEPGANVTVNGEPADTDASGAFKKMVYVTSEGQSWIVVKAVDGAGNETVRRESVLIQTN